MSKGERSREKLVGTTAALLQRQGYHATGLQQIVQESRAPRGSLYFYFPGGKEELAVAALERSAEAWRERLLVIIDAAPDMAAAVVDVCEELARDLESSEFQAGCPLAAVALEAAGTSERLRETCAASYRAWEALIADRLGRLGLAEDAAGLAATYALGCIEGALMLARVYRDAAPVRLCGLMLREQVARLA